MKTLLLSALLLSPIATAAPTPIKIELANTRQFTVGAYTIAVADQGGTLLVRKGKQQAILLRTIGLGEITGTFDAQTGALALVLEDATCIGKTAYKFTTSNFES